MYNLIKIGAIVDVLQWDTYVYGKIEILVTHINFVEKRSLSGPMKELT